MAIIPCDHNHSMSPMPQSSPRGLIIVRSVHHVMDRLIYHHHDGQVVTTEFRPRVLPTQSRPFNPLCPNCEINFLNYLVNSLRYSSARSAFRLHELQQRVRRKLADIDHRYNHDDHGALIDWVVCDLTSGEEWHTWDLQDYIAWVQVGEFMARCLRRRSNPASHAAIRALERVEFEDMLLEGSKWKEEDCAVCLEGLGPAATKAEQPVVLKLPCQHAFHGSCIVEWLCRNHVCPLCRLELPTQEH